MKYFHIKWTVLLVILFQSFSYSQIQESYFYDSEDSFLRPRSIEKVKKGGYIVTGFEYGIPFVLKLDSLLQVEQYIVSDYVGFESNNFNETLYNYSDSIKYLVSLIRDSQTYDQNLAIISINDKGDFIEGYSYDFGSSEEPLNSLKLSDTETVVAITGQNNLLVSFDSINLVKHIYNYTFEDNSYEINKLHFINDSLILLFGKTDNSSIISLLDYSLNIIKSLEINIGNTSYGDSDVFVENDSIFLIFKNGWSGDFHIEECHFYTLDLELNVHNSYLYRYMGSNFDNPSHLGFVKVDSSNFIFYAGNNLFKTSRTHEILNIIGGSNSFIGFFITDSTTLILYKNGFVPSLINSIDGGSEFVILSGNSIDSVLSLGADNFCIEPSKHPLANFVSNYSYSYVDLTRDTMTYYSTNAISPFLQKNISYKLACPDPSPSIITDEVIFNLDIYPNPANNVLNISSDKEINEIVFYSVAGSVVESRDIHSRDASIDISSLNSGMYFLGVFVGGEYIMKKIVVE